LKALYALAYFMFVAPIIFQCAMLTLQVSAYRKHGHGSFLLLAISTTAGLAFLIGEILFAASSAKGLDVTLPWRMSLAAAFLVQLVLGFWGTFALFRSYGTLATLATSRVNRDGSI